MGWRLIDKPKTLKATRKLAQEFEEMEPCPHDRPLSERRLMIYRRILTAGGFRPVTWASALCKETEGVYRVNGKHTSKLLLTTVPFPDDFYVIVEEYECDTLEDVARLYSTFDSGTQSRSANDIYQSFAGTIPELRGLPARLIRNCVAGIDVYQTEATTQGSNSRSTASERAERLMDHVEFVQWVGGIMSADVGGQDRTENRQQAKHLGRAAVIAAMLATWTRNKKGATDFWCAVRDETGAEPSCADRKLARFLLTAGIQDRVNNSRKTVTVREMYVKCLHAWNAWRKQENTDLRYYADKPIPDVR